MIKIGLNKEKAKKLSLKLNLLLANYQVFYQNLRGFHWNLKGSDFFELHLKFEELYNDAQLKIDEIAERILTLEETPLHTFQDYIDVAEVKTVKNITNGREGIKITLANFQTLLLVERELMEMSSDAGDEGTNTLISDYISQTEKTVWMLSSFLG
jgi:starvation-inducible DNA-binding protein